MIHDTLQSDRDALLDELRLAGATVTSPKSIRCPFHDDHSPSMAAYKGDDGVWRVRCHTVSCAFGGDLFDVRSRRTGRPLPDVLREAGADSRPPKAKPVDDLPKYASIEALMAAIPGATRAYPYREPDTKLVDLVVVRIDRSDGTKSFRQGSRIPGGELVMRAPAKPWPLYNRGRIRDAEHVVVVEGEKCVHAMHRIGIVATTSPGGAGKGLHADWAPLAGKAVMLWPDNDAAGVAHMVAVRGLLEQLNPRPRISVVDPSHFDLPPKGDAADLIEGELTEVARDLVDEVLAGARSVSVLGELDELLDDMISGRRRAIDLPWDQLSRLTKALLPGTVTILCGQGGALKSFAALQANAEWHRADIPVAMLALEDTRAYHLHRALSQQARCASLFDDEWVRSNAEIVQSTRDEHAAFLARFGECLFEAPSKMASYDDVLAWMRARLEAGARVLTVDPITIASPSDRPWVADAKFLDAAKKCVVAHGASLILVTHPKTGGAKAGIGLDFLAGGAAFPRFAHTVLWIEQLEPAKELRVRSAFGVHVVEVDRVVRILKARNGRGTGKRIAFDFNQNGSLQLRELGIVVKEGQR